MLELILSLFAGFSAAMLSSAGGSNFPAPLTREEEEKCFRLAHRNGDENARAKLIEHNLRLVAHIVRKYYAAHPAEEDLISIGTIGLIKSVDSFDFDKGARFATYAAKCIQNAILSQRHRPAEKNPVGSLQDQAMTAAGLFFYGSDSAGVL